MKIAMQEPIFLEFADICMRVLHPETTNKISNLQRIQEIVDES